MNKIGYVFDSTCAMNPEIVKKYDFEFVSMYLNIEGEDVKSMDIDETEFIKNFPNYKSLRSASPSPQFFVDAYEKQFAKGYKDVIVLTLSRKLSSTYDVAINSIGLLDEDKQAHVHVVDTLIASFNFDSLITSLTEELDKDLEVEEMLKQINRRLEHNFVIFEVNDLKHLHRGGRLSKVAFYLAEILKIKPVVECSDGVLKQVGKNRNRSKNIDLMIAKLQKIYDRCKYAFVNYFSYGHDQEEAALARIIEIIKQSMPRIVLNRTQKLDPVFNTHVGVEGYTFCVTAYN